MISAELFNINNKKLFCNLDYFAIIALFYMIFKKIG
jgi:hypothetical protein